jgi:histidine triad (HIT) family protein
MTECIFCKIAQKSVHSRIIYETDDIMAFHDLNPQAPTHILIISKKHIPKLSDSSKKDIELLGKIQFAARDMALKMNLEDGFRLVLNNGKKAG